MIDQTGKIWICTSPGTPGTWGQSAVTATDFAPSGLPGATAASRYAGATASGAPVSGTFALGDFTVDQTGVIWVCTTAGTPGVWASLGGGLTNPMTTSGDTVYGAASGTPQRLAGSTSATKKFLTQTGNGTVSAAPAWGTIAGADVPVLNQNTTGTAANITGTLDTVPAPVAAVSLNSQKITSLANGSGAQDAAAFGQIPLIDATTGDIAASPGTAAAGAIGKAADAGHVHPQPPMLAPTGLTGATAATRYAGATAAGAPASGTFAAGDFVIDQAGSVWVCTAAGTPGTWVQAGSKIASVLTFGATSALALTWTGAGSFGFASLAKPVSGNANAIVGNVGASDTLRLFNQIAFFPNSGIATRPPTSHSLLGSLGSLAIGTAWQNTLNNDVLINVVIPVTSGTAGYLVAGVGSTNTPTQDQAIPATSAAEVVTLSYKVPSNWYLLISTSGTIACGTPVTTVSA